MKTGKVRTGARKTLTWVCTLALVGGCLAPFGPAQARAAEEEAIYTTHQGNPYLPLWEYIPDGEPYVFEDPDNPGEYRAYIYGSHDTLKTQYCGKDLVVWSAPVDDLTQWRYDGVIFESVVNGAADTLYAPDMALVEDPETGEKTYYLYPNNQSWGRTSMVAKSDRPDGPFVACNWKPGSTTETEGPLGFDPAVYVDDDGTVYGYWGFQDSYWCKLDPENMSTLAPGEQAHHNIPTYDQMMAADYNPAEYNIVLDENTQKWGFFEASSIRKVGNKYVFIYSRNGLPSEPTGKNYNQLAYGYSDSPAGPWKWGGIVVDAAGEVIPNGRGGYDRTFAGGNTHGSICEIDGQWYVFYHRNLHTYARQAMVEPITVEWDEAPVSEGGEVRISMAEVTSNGFFLDGLDPYRKHSAGIVSYLTGGASIVPAYTRDTTTLPITNLRDGAVAGIKYFNFDGAAPEGGTSLQLELIPRGVDATIDVYLRPTSAANTPVVRENGVITSVGEGSEKIGSVTLTSDMPQVMTALEIPTPAVDEKDGQWGLFFVFNGGSGSNICDFYNVQFLSGNGFFQDSFDAGLDLWQVAGQAAARDGALELTGAAQAVSRAGITWTDYALKARVEELSGALQVRFRQSNEENYYSLEVTEDALTLSTTVFGETTVLGRAAHRFAPPYDIAVDAVGDSLSVRLNGSMLLNLRDDSQEIGGVGFAAQEGASAQIAQVSVGDSTFTPPPAEEETQTREDAIFLDGAPLEGFAADTASYSIQVEGDAPVVSATSTDRNVVVGVQQADSVPGSAQVRFLAADGSVRSYSLLFYRGPEDIPVTGGEMPAQLAYPEQATDTGKNLVSFTENGIVLDVQQGGDFPSVPNNYPAVEVQKSLAGNWQFDVQFEADREMDREHLGDGESNYQCYGIGINAENGNTLRAIIQNVDWDGDKQKALFDYKENNAALAESSFEVPGTTAYFRLVKSDGALTCYYSGDGVDYRVMSSGVKLSQAMENVKIQLFGSKVFGQTAFETTIRSIQFTDLPEASEPSQDQLDVEAAAARVGHTVLIPAGEYADDGARMAAAQAVLDEMDLGGGVSCVLSAGEAGYVLTLTKGESTAAIYGFRIVENTADWAMLQQAIEEAAALAAEDYTPATWNKLESALRKAEACTPETDVVELIAAYERLTQALEHLEPAQPAQEGLEVDVAFEAADMDQVEGTLVARVRLHNPGEGEQTGLTILALFDRDGRMVGYDTQGIALPGGYTDIVQVSLDVPFAPGEGEGYTAKVFVWDGLNLDESKGQPLSEVFRLD